jgi:hypothetical protein
MSEAIGKTKGVLQRFTAVDLIIIAIFAVLLRTVFYYTYRALYVAFPVNMAVFPVFMAFTMACLLVLVPKPGTVLLWTVTWQAINFFFQGESPLYLAMYIPIPFVVEGVFWLIKRRGDTLPSSLVGNMFYQLGHTIATYIAIVYVFLMEWPFDSFLVILVISVVLSANFGALAGFQLGKQLKRLIG